MKLTAIILTRGDKDLVELKKSLNFCEEVIVSVNSEIVNFAAIRNNLAKKSKGEWLLYIDDDEVVPPKLKDEILDVVKSNLFPGYAIPRRNIIFGKEMKHCGLWPDYVLRLIKKEKLLGWEGDLHEQPKIEGKIGYLKEPLIHKKHDQLSDMVDKTNAWSEIEADLMIKANHPKMNIFRFCSAGFREFWHRMVVQMAFLDGAEGVIYAMYQVFSRLISYSKLWEKQQS
jgi:glycosyltransferase involved in cell wall biosynthesis